MRYLLLVLYLNFPIALTNAQTDSLRLQLIEFLKVTNDIPNNIESSKILNSLIINGLDNPQLEFSNKPGIYKFGTLTTHSSFHLLILDEGTSNIVNMKESLDSIILAIIDYYNKHQSKYTINDLCLSMTNTISLYRINMDAVPWKIEKKQ